MLTFFLSIYSESFMIMSDISWALSFLMALFMQWKKYITEVIRCPEESIYAYMYINKLYCK